MSVTLNTGKAHQIWNESLISLQTTFITSIGLCKPKMLNSIILLCRCAIEIHAH